MRREEITAIVLCGGSAARLGTVDKTLVSVGGRALAAHTIETLAPQVGGVVLSCGRDPKPYEALGYPVATDQHPGDGPVGGIVSALPQVETEWILTHPGDTPFPDASLVERLAAGAAQTGLAVPRTGDYRQHLVMLLRRRWVGSLASYYEHGGRAVRFWLDDAGTTEVDMSDVTHSFFNVNTPDDLAEAERRLIALERQGA